MPPTMPPTIPPTIPPTMFGATASTTEISLAEGKNNTTVQCGVPGPWSECLPHFRLVSTPSNEDDIQTEYFVDRRQAPDALAEPSHWAPEPCHPFHREERAGGSGPAAGHRGGARQRHRLYPNSGDGNRGTEPAICASSAAHARSAVANRTSRDVRRGGLHRDFIQHVIVAGVNYLRVVMEVRIHSSSGYFSVVIDVDQYPRHDSSHASGSPDPLWRDGHVTADHRAAGEDQGWAG